MGEGEGGDGGDFFGGGAADGGDGAEGAEEEASAFGADSGDFIEDRALNALVADFAVVGEGEPVGLVAEAAEEKEPGAVHGEDGFAEGVASGEIGVLRGVGVEGRDKDDLLFFGEADHGDGELEGITGAEGGAELALAAVDHDEVGEFGELGIAVQIAAEAAGDDFVHHGEVVGGFVVPFDAEPAVLVFGGFGVLTNDHGADGGFALDV